MAKLTDLLKHGQSIWYDYIHRDMFTSGEITALIKKGVRGMTSNPAIFKNAIAGSDTYDAQIHKLASAGKSTQEIYDALVVQDISDACDALSAVYKKSEGADGFVSLEVSPTLAHDTSGTITDAKRYSALVNKKNLMIKVPAAKAGLPAVTELIAAGININVTLIFSNENYREVAEAYIAGLEKRAAAGEDLSSVASVASYFISRTDGVVDKQLAEKGETALAGKISVANAKVAFAIYQQIFSGSRWEKLAAKGARPQRLLWASTGTKNPDYSDILYVDELIGKGTVNTVPPATLAAFLDHGTVADRAGQNVEQAEEQLRQLAALGIDLDAITTQLQIDGIAQFVSAFEGLMTSIDEKKKSFSSEIDAGTAALGIYERQVGEVFAEMRDNHVLQRIWSKDHTVWKDDPDEIENRLDWLDSPVEMQNKLPEINTFTEDARNAGFKQVLLLGMGGSSMAPEVFRAVFGVRTGFLDLSVLDSTDPGAVLAREKQLNLEKTLFIVSTKSGGTVETLSFFKYFYRKLVALNGDSAGDNFVAITDEGSALHKLAKQYSFRKIFLNNPNIGGRFSALSYFGLVPAALVGVDLAVLLEKAQGMLEQCRNRQGNTGVWLGVVMGEMAKSGRDKLTLITSESLVPIGAWIEQLVAESAGKEQKGILPVTTELLGRPESYADDRFFVSLKLSGENENDEKIEALAAAGHPVVQFTLPEIDALGAEFYRWEMATAVACRGLGINPFNQPDVESAKSQAREVVAKFLEQGEISKPAPLFEEDGVAVFADSGAGTLKELLAEFLSHATRGTAQGYVALQAYLTPDEVISKRLQQLATKIRDTTKLATTFGFGPRFLHSTGQLHKGDAGHGLFLQFTSTAGADALIPDTPAADEASMPFSILISAQRLGDRKALIAKGRTVVTLDLGDNPAGQIQRLIEMI